MLKRDEKTCMMRGLKDGRTGMIWGLKDGDRYGKSFKYIQRHVMRHLKSEKTEEHNKETGMAGGL